MKSLGSINVLGMTTEVVLCTPEEVGEERLNDEENAAFICEDQTIYLHKDRNIVPSRVKEHIIHECVHAWLEAGGAQNYLQGVCGLEAGPAWDKVEENLVRALTPAISSSLADLVKVISLLPKVIK